jgi:hypothetical protein
MPYKRRMRMGTIAERLLVKRREAILKQVTALQKELDEITEFLRSVGPSTPDIKEDIRSYYSTTVPTLSKLTCYHKVGVGSTLKAGCCTVCGKTVLVAPKVEHYGEELA